MEILKDNNLFDWIKNNIHSIKPPVDMDWQGYTPANFIPAKFESYMKVFHGIYHKDTRERISWKKLALERNLIFHSEFNEYSIGSHFPEAYYINDEGSLDKESYENLLGILIGSNFLLNTYCFYENRANLTGNSILINGEASEVLNYDCWKKFEFLFCNTPTYLWPENKYWVIYTGFNMFYSIVGCDKEKSVQILNNPYVEAFEIARNTRIDLYSDVINNVIN